MNKQIKQTIYQWDEKNVQKPWARLPRPWIYSSLQFQHYVYNKMAKTP